MTADGTPTLTEALLDLVENRQRRLRTALIARVEAWYPETQSIDALPLVREAVEPRPAEFAYLEMPVVPMVPFCAALTVGGFTIQAAPTIGDVVLLIVLDRDPDAYLAAPGAAPVDPPSPRHHQATDAVALPLGVPRTAAPLPSIDDGELVIGRQDGTGEVRVRQDGSVELGARDVSKSRAARENDSTTSTSTEDPAFWAWVSQVDGFIRALTGVGSPESVTRVGSAATAFNTSTGGSPPTSQTGRVSSGSDAVEVE